MNEKARWVFVDESGKILDKNPTKEESKYLEIEIVSMYRPGLRNLKRATDAET